jgi:hypothetical protein
MIRVKPVLRANAEEKTNKTSNNTNSGSDKKEKVKKEYIQLVKQREMTVSDKAKLVFSVSKTEEGEPHVDIRLWLTSERYSGPTREGVNFNIENMEEFMSILEDLNSECEEKGI